MRFVLKCCFAAFIFCLADVKVSAQSASRNALLFVENTDHFPSNDLFVFSRVQTPWSRDNTHFNTNHDSVAVRIHNNGSRNLVVSNLTLSDTTTWKFVKLKGANYVADSSLPVTIASGGYVDLTVAFIAVDTLGGRIKMFH